MDHNKVDHMFKQLTEIAHEAGAVLLQYFRKDICVDCKDDGSPVTKADRAAESLIEARLYSLWPDIPPVGEETARTSEPVGSYEYFWLIDPLDGTREFINDSDEFTVNIALMKNGSPVLGVVYAPAKDLMYYGGAGYGSYRISGGGRIERLPVTGTESGRIAVTISRRHPTQGVESDFLAKLRQESPVEIISVGSSLKFCMVAEGSASLYFRAGTTMYWDTAAGQAVVEGAGFIVRRWDNHENLTYIEPELINPSFIAVNPMWLPLLEKVL